MKSFLSSFKEAQSLLAIQSSQCSCKFILYPTKTKSNMMASTCYLSTCLEHQDYRAQSNESGKVKHPKSAPCHVMLFSPTIFLLNKKRVLLPSSVWLCSTYHSSPRSLTFISFNRFPYISLPTAYPVSTAAVSSFYWLVLHFCSHRNQVQSASGNEGRAPL